MSGPDEAENPEAGEHGPRDTPPAPPSGGDHNADEESGEPHRGAKRKKHNGYKWATLAFNFLTFTATAFAAYQADRLANLTRNMAQDARDVAAQNSRDAANTLQQTQFNNTTNALQTAAALQIANDNAVIAGKQLATAQDTAKRQLRAYVSAGLDDKNPIVPGVNAVNIKLMNRGMTPAYKIRAVSNTVVARIDSKDIPLNPKLDGASHIKTGVIYPNESGGLWASTMPAHPNQLDRPGILAGELVFYVFGKINYDDAFGVNHFTNFCYVANISKPIIVGVVECDWGHEAN